MKNPEVLSAKYDPHRFIKDIAALSPTNGKTPNGVDVGRTAPAFSEIEDTLFEHTKTVALTLLEGLQEGTDYQLTTDAIGNFFVELIGTKSEAEPLMCGSHLDSVPNGGQYDGVAGVATGLQMLENLVQTRGEGGPSEKNFIFVVWRSEESSPRNGRACLGSQVATGQFQSGAIDNVVYDREHNTALLEHMQDKDPNLDWSEVADLAEGQADHPVLSRYESGDYLELHIEQSRNVALNNKQVGISEGGIGGAWRNEFSLDSPDPEMIDLEVDKTKKLTIKTFGKSDHTGGTPPNKWHLNARNMADFENREDALVQACELLTRLLKVPGVHLLKSEFADAGSMTAVPSAQLSEVVVPHDFDYESFFAKAAADVALNYEVEAETLKESRLAVVSSRAHKALAVPLFMNRVNSAAYRRNGLKDLAHGTINGFCLTPSSLTWKEDFREVDTDLSRKIMLGVRAKTEKVLSGLTGKWKHLGAKSHATIDEGLKDGLVAAAEAHQQSYHLMPVMPGHDADTMARYKQWRSAMVLVRQEDGVSHNPAESMTQEAYDDGAKVLISLGNRLMSQA